MAQLITSISFLVVFAICMRQCVARSPPIVGIEANRTKTCMDEAKNANGSCAAFHTCCGRECGGRNFTASCSEERALSGSCICKGLGNSSSSNTTSRVQCGRQAVPPKRTEPGRIVGGVPANAHSWPWQVSLQIGGDHHCGGSLVDAKHVITAAHCTIGKTPDAIKIIAGIHDRRASESSKQTVNVEKIINHPDYNKINNSNDISIMRLASPVQFNANVSPICIPEQDVKPGKACVTTGWGETQGTGDDNILQQVSVPIVATNVCGNATHYVGKIDDTMICAGVSGKDSCQGDSGGPLVCQRSDATWELQGVTSWGRGCGVENHPGIYARVTKFKTWIKQNLKP